MARKATTTNIQEPVDDMAGSEVLNRCCAVEVLALSDDLNRYIEVASGGLAIGPPDFVCDEV